jgi:hypothetical protein
MEHRYPVDCYRFFSDGMLALARYVSLEPLHAHTNSAPSLADIDWYSRSKADSILVARKPYAGPTRYPDFKTFQCVPADQELLLGGFVRQPTKKRLIEILSDMGNLISDIPRALVPMSAFLALKKRRRGS